MKVTLLEKEVEEAIFNNQLLEEYGIKCVARQFRMGSAGVVDILAYDLNNKQWVIVEIKRDVIDHKTLSQALRYKYWFDKRRSMMPPSINRQKPSYCILIGARLSYDLLFLPEIVYRENMDVCYQNFSIAADIKVRSYNTHQREYDCRTDEEAERFAADCYFNTQQHLKQ